MEYGMYMKSVIFRPLRECLIALHQRAEVRDDAEVAQQVFLEVMAHQDRDVMIKAFGAAFGAKYTEGNEARKALRNVIREAFRAAINRLSTRTKAILAAVDKVQEHQEHMVKGLRATLVGKLNLIIPNYYSTGHVAIGDPAWIE
jgi:hypothetical protein